MTKYYVTMTDKFMSGRGEARGKNNKLVFECKDMTEAMIVEDNANSRTDQKNVNIRSTKPYYNQARNYVQYKTKKDYPSWYKAGYFNRAS